MQPIRTAIIGYGLAGSVFHAPIIRAVEGLALTKVVSSDPAKVLRDHPDVDVVASPDALFADPDVDLVVIATPNTTHYPLARQALEAGKHVVVDKPFVIRAEEGLRLVELAKKQGRVLSVYQNRRWDNDFLTVKKLVNGGLLGDVHTYQAHYDRFRPEVRNRWREQNLEGSGILYDLGSHLIDQALHLFGLPQTVWADLAVQRTGGQAVDYFHLVLDFGATKAILHAGSLVKQPGPRYQVHGSKGSFLKYGIDSQEELLRQGKRPGAAGWGEDRPEWYGELTTEVGDVTLTSKIPTETGCYEAYYRSIVRAIAGDGEVPVDARDAVHTIRVIECAMRSSQEKRTVPFA